MRWLVLILGFAVAPAHAESAQQALARFVDTVDTLSAGFEQVQRDERGDVLQSQSGRMWLSRSASRDAGQGRFRWSYEQPYEQLMVCDGSRIYLYDPDLAQVTVRPAAQALAGTPAQLLSRRSGLADEFEVADAGERDGSRVVRLTPKAADSDFKSVELWLRNGAPQRMRFLDQLGGSTEVRFKEVRTNVALDEKLFRFTPPQGVEVVEATEPPT